MTIIVGSLIQAVGSICKIIGLELATPATDADTTANNASFPIVFIGQVLCACAEAFLLGLPAQIAGVWFSKSEVPIATAIGVFGNRVRLWYAQLCHPRQGILRRC